LDNDWALKLALVRDVPVVAVLRIEERSDAVVEVRDVRADGDLD